MKNTKLVRFVESLVLLPALTMGGSIGNGVVGPVSQAVIEIVNSPSVVSSQKQNMSISDLLAFNNAMDQKLQAQKIKADTIDAYFKVRDMPLEGLGMKMVLEAEKNNLDWRLLPAIAIRESTGGKFACKKLKYNSFGWGSCKIGFNSNEEAIETVALNLGGNNPNTAKYYKNKTLKQILRAYNPPSVVPKYAEQVIWIMNDIGEADAILEISNATT